MNNNIVLTKDFASLVEPLEDGMRSLALHWQGAANIPQLELEGWMGENDSCYTFAINRASVDPTNPGQINDPDQGNYRRDSFEHYTMDVHDGAMRDGLRPLGHDFYEALMGVNEDERPVALFFREDSGEIKNAYDFHWYSLRHAGEDMYTDSGFVWAERFAWHPAKIVEGEVGGNEMADIFKSASEQDYIHFAGFYAAPVSIENPPTERLEFVRQFQAK